MSVITPIIRVFCPNTRAGLVRIWAVSCYDVADVLFDDDGFVYNAVLNSGVTWKEINFEPRTGFLFQEKLTVKGYTTYIKQQIYFEIYGLSILIRKALEDLNDECCLHIIAQDDAGNYHYCGITQSEEGHVDEGMRTGDGSSETGASQQNDVAKYTETLACICDFYAPITLNPDNMNPLFWTMPDDQYWTMPDGQFWTIKQ